MFAKLSAEKISSTVCHGIWKEQKRNPDVSKLSTENEAQMTASPSKERRAREQKKWNLLNFYNEKRNSLLKEQNLSTVIQGLM